MSTTASAHRPNTLTAYSVREFEKDGQTQSSWIPIGVAFAHRDGNGWDLRLDALPIDGKIALRRAKPKTAVA